MINIKTFDKYKKVFEDFIEVLPLKEMEENIQNSNDPFVNKLYQSVISAEQQTKDPRYKKIYHNIGIIGIYSLFDIVYSDYIRWIFSQTKNLNFNAKPPNFWRINKIMEEK